MARETPTVLLLQCSPLSKYRKPENKYVRLDGYIYFITIHTKCYLVLHCIVDSVWAR